MRLGRCVPCVECMVSKWNDACLKAQAFLQKHSNGKSMGIWKYWNLDVEPDRSKPQSDYKIEEFEAAGFEDLATLAKSLKIEQTGLRNLTAIFFKQRLSKSAQLSNWQKRPLSPSQIQYAATDAWISRELYLIMKARLKRLD